MEMEVDIVVNEAAEYFYEGLRLIERIHGIKEMKEFSYDRDIVSGYMRNQELDGRIARELEKMKQAFEEAIGLSEEALMIDPQHYEALKIKGSSYFHLGEFHTAPEPLISALKIRETRTVLWQISRSLVEQKEYAKALEYVDRLLQRDPRYEKGLVVACEIGEITKDFQIALEALHVLVGTHPEKSSYRNRLYRLLNWKMKPRDLIAMAFPTCKSCGKSDGWQVKGTLVQRMICNSCGTQYRVNTGRIRKEFLKIPPPPPVTETRTQRRRRKSSSPNQSK